MSFESEKGDLLEDAVKAIETLLLRSKASLAEANYRIRGKYIVTVQGVRHEVDVFVEIDLGDGYKSRYLFECKNWKDPVGKTEIIDFSEKIKVLQAQTGYFVGRTFTESARNQALLDPRMILLEAKDVPDALAVPMNLSIATNYVYAYDAAFYEAGPNPATAKPRRVDMETSELRVKGERVPLKTLMNDLTNAGMGKVADPPDFDSRPDERFDLIALVDETFEPGTVVLDGFQLSRVRVEAKFKRWWTVPAVISRFEVGSRGRYTQLEKVGPDSENFVQVALVETSSETAIVECRIQVRGAQRQNE